jgi:aspartate aminotransferase
MAERAKALRNAGRDVISLSLGELDFDTPAHIVSAANDAAKSGFTRYTAADGAPIIKKAVIEKFARDNAIRFHEHQIHVAGGCKQVIYNALAATINPGDEVVVFAPYWVSYVEQVTFCGGMPVIVPTTFESGFLPDRLSLERAMSSRTKWVIVNTPNNPSGAVYPPAVLKGIVETVARHPHAMILSDEIYEHLAYDGVRHSTMLECAPGMRDRILTVNGVSKAYAMTGWRIGFAAGPSKLIEAMGKVQSQATGNPSSISQASAAVALTGDQSLIEDWRAEFQERRDEMVRVLRLAPRLRVPDVCGAFYAYVDVSGCIGARTMDGKVLETDFDVAEYFLDADVAVVPGEAFGMSPFVRVSFALDRARVGEACRRIVMACAQLSNS